MDEIVKEMKTKFSNFKDQEMLKWCPVAIRFVSDEDKLKQDNSLISFNDQGRVSSTKNTKPKYKVNFRYLDVYDDIDRKVDLDQLDKLFKGLIDDEKIFKVNELKLSGFKKGVVKKLLSHKGMNY